MHPEMSSSAANARIFDDIGARTASSANPIVKMKHGVIRTAVKVRLTSGRTYVYAVEATEHRGPPPGIGPSGFALRWSVAFLVSGVICYLLTRYLTAPILRLREASKQLAQGFQYSCRRRHGAPAR